MNGLREYRDQSSKRIRVSLSMVPPKKGRDSGFRSQAPSESMASSIKESNQMKVRQTQSGRSGDKRAQQSQIIQCQICRRSHSGLCRVVTGVCFRCGETGHYMKDCQLRAGEPVQSERSSSMSHRRRGIGKRRNKAESSTQQEIRSTARVYNLKINEDCDNPDIVAGRGTTNQLRRIGNISVGRYML
ncbi:uncharacterized protein LOC120154282 [Hibiscus syriacus]|uniref:uncharacterized protein LOC120154282 n=1 Tax=Hibiscus syriacus TaxID=106335 RepID=UPI0019250603|nr:uncharacterized protein LOC120154282 [Hibiscus syriacus]